MTVLPSIAAGYLKNRKRHTVLTETGIVLSVVLMTVSLIAVSTVMATLRNITSYTDGTYDVIFNELSKDDVVLISNMDIFEEKCRYGISSYTDLVTSNLDGDYSSVNYLSYPDGRLYSGAILRFGSDNTELMPEKMRSLTEGRLPQKDGEIALSVTESRDMGLGVGDTAEFIRYECVNKGTADDAENPENILIPDILQSHYTVTEIKELSFEVVGIASDYSIVSTLDTQLKSFIPQKDKLLLTFNAEQNDFYWNMHHAFMDIGLEIDDYDYAMNQQYLNMINKGAEAKSYNTVFYMLVYLVVLFIMFCVRMVIDNSFEIASHERIRQYGLLRAVGASKKQVLMLLVHEALQLSVLGVPLGLLLGTGTAYAIFRGVSSESILSLFSSEYDLTEMAEFTVTAPILISSAVIGVFWVLISAIGTGMRVNKLSPVEAMNASSKRIRLRKPERKAKEGRAGIEWLIAFRSVRRSNKRFIITLLSMAVSIVIYAGFSYAVKVTEDHYADIYSESRVPYDYELNLYDMESEDTPQRVEEMNASGYFENVQFDSYMTFMVQSDDNNNRNETISGFYSAEIHPINETTYKRITGKDDFAEFESSGGFIIDNTSDRDGEIYQLYNEKTDKVIAAEFADYEVYDPMEFELYGFYDTEFELYSSTASQFVGCMAEKNYLDIVKANKIDTAAVYQGNIDGERAYLYIRTIYADAKDGQYDEAVKWLDRHYFDYYTDHYSQKNNSYATLSLVKICGIFIVVLLSLIAAVNIINIISTNVLNRTSEIGMLRACGMSPLQVYKMIFSESVLISGIASISAALVVEGMILIIYLPFYFHLGGIFTMSDMPVSLSFIDPIVYLIIGAVAAFALGAAAAGAAVSRIIKTPIVDAIKIS